MAECITVRTVVARVRVRVSRRDWPRGADADEVVEEVSCGRRESVYEGGLEGSSFSSGMMLFLAMTNHTSSWFRLVVGLQWSLGSPIVPISAVARA